MTDTEWPSDRPRITEKTALWVEGVGSDRGLTAFFGWRGSAAPYARTSVFDNCMENGETLFTYNDFNAPAWKNPIDMLTGSPEWDYDSYYATGEYCSTEPTYKINDESMGFMTKDGKTYHRIYLLELLSEDSSGGWMYALTEPSVGIREENGKVYAEYDSYMALANDKRVGLKGELPFLVTKDGEILLYDFTVGVGDRYPASDACSPILVNTVETVSTLDGVQRKLITLDNGLQLLEGIGCLNSNGLLLHYLYTSGHWFQDYYGNSITHDLCMYYKNGKAVYKNKRIGTINGDAKCATPTIAYDKGKLVFSCETEGAECVYEIKCTDAGSGNGGKVSLSQTYEIRVHATLDGYEDSDVAVATIGWRNGQPVMEGFSSVTMEAPTNLPPLGEANADVNGDGKVDVADIATIISVMAGQLSE